MVYKPKRKKRQEEEEEEQEDEEKDSNEEPRITQQEIRDAIEGHLNRATQLFKTYF